MSGLELVVWISLAAVVYHIVGYPLALLALARTRSSVVRPDTALEAETVTLIVAAYNEERVIAEKIENSLALSYPVGRLSIVVVTDGSTDRTPEIVRTYADRGVVCLHDPVRRGKSHALNRAVAATTGDIVVLSDANNLYERDALGHLVRALREPRVGAVSGAKKVLLSGERAASGGDGLYWRFESKLKEAESGLGGTVSGDGEMLALRRSLYFPIPAEIVNDDLYLTLQLVGRGYRMAYEPRAISFEQGSITMLEDFRVKVRMVAGGFQSFLGDWRAVFASGRFAIKFVSHKLLRWLMPLFLLLLLVASGALLERRPFAVLFALQVLFYGAAALGWLLNRRGLRPMLAYVPFYFTVMNVAAGAGLLRFLRGAQTPLWTKAAR